MIKYFELFSIVYGNFMSYRLSYFPMIFQLYDIKLLLMQKVLIDAPLELRNPDTFHAILITFIRKLKLLIFLLQVFRLHLSS